jgi:RNA-directed DNA polymerase
MGRGAFRGRDGSGSAFFLRHVGLVTAAHCVEDVEEVEVYRPSKPANKFKARVSRRDAHRDLALLGHEIPTNEYFELERSSRPIAVGDELTAVGYPGFGPGDRTNVRLGNVTSLPVKSAVRLIEVSQELAQGMSGGPLLASDHAVKGIVHKGGPSQGRNFATHIDELNNWLTGVPGEKPHPPGPGAARQ